MPAVRLSDIVIPAVYNDYQVKDTTETTALMQSGVIVRSPMFDEIADGPSNIVHMPTWKDLSNGEADIISDDPDQRAVPGKIGTGMQVAVKLLQHKSWQATALASQMAGSNAMGRIKGVAESWWARLQEKLTIAMSLGVMASNIAKNGGDMVIDVSADLVSAPTAANKFSRKSFGDAVFTLGDQFGKIEGIAMNYKVYQTAWDNDEIEEVRDSAGTLVMRTYNGIRVTVDDNLPVIAGVNHPKFVTVLFGSGAFGYGVGSPARPVEVTWDAAAANGGGTEVLHTRKNWLLHPFGYAFDPAAITAGLISPTMNDLKKPAAWTRVFDERKQVPMAFLVTNA